MTTITRFAPSPTGFLHVGNVRMALINFLLSKKFNGKFILRIDDTDLERSKTEYETAIKNDLKWLNLEWQATFNQSNNLELYNKYLLKLKEKNLIYPCYETKEELDYKRKIQLAKGLPPIYDRSALKLTEKQKLQYENEGRKPYYRFKILHEEIEWNDLIKGPIKIQGDYLSDPVLIKENGIFLYSFSSVVDDIENSITHIIRGEDHISNTAMHIQLFKCLGAKPPIFGHMSLLSLLEGGELSKREGSNSIIDLKNKGIHSLAILNYLFMLGQSEKNQIYMSVLDMIKDFDLNKYSKSLVKFDNKKLLQINYLVLQNLSFYEIKKDLDNLNLTHITEELWNLYKNNIETILDLSKYYDVLYGDIFYKTEKPSLIQIAIDSLPLENFTPQLVDSWIEHIIKKALIKKKELFTTLRIALTGNNVGPNFKDLILALGSKKVKERLIKSL